MCKHKTCKKFNAIGVKGVACIVLNWYNGKTPVVMLGKEKGGQYKGTWNLCAGKIEPKDGGCVLLALLRELGEEFKIFLQFGKIFDFHFRSQNGSGPIRYFMMGKTAVFVGTFIGCSTTKINGIIDHYNNDWQLHWSFKEMSCVDWVDISNQFNPVGLKKNIQISTFALNAIKQLDLNSI